MDSDLKLNVFKICKSIVNPPNFGISSMPPHTSNYHPPTPPPPPPSLHVIEITFSEYLSPRTPLERCFCLKDYIFYKKQLKLMFFLNRNAHTGPLLKNVFKNLKFGDKSSI